MDLSRNISEVEWNRSHFQTARLTSDRHCQLVNNHMVFQNHIQASERPDKTSLIKTDQSDNYALSWPFWSLTMWRPILEQPENPNQKWLVTSHQSDECWWKLMSVRQKTVSASGYTPEVTGPMRTFSKHVRSFSDVPQKPGWWHRHFGHLPVQIWFICDTDLAIRALHGMKVCSC